MKKLMKIMAMGFLIALTWAGIVCAAGSCTTPTQTRGTLHSVGTSIIQVAVTCTADAADGSFPDVLIENVGGNLLSVYVDPGTTAPTTAFDMTVELGTTGIDLLGGAGADIATAADAMITPLIGTPSVPAGFAGNLTVTLSNNSVNSATVTYYLILTY